MYLLFDPEIRCVLPQYVFYVTHWSACMFYFIAVQNGLDHDTWIGRHFDDVVDLSLPVRCPSDLNLLLSLRAHENLSIIVVLQRGSE